MSACIHTDGVSNMDHVRWHEGLERVSFPKFLPTSEDVEQRMVCKDVNELGRDTALVALEDENFTYVTHA